MLNCIGSRSVICGASGTATRCKVRRESGIYARNQQASIVRVKRYVEWILVAALEIFDKLMDLSDSVVWRGHSLLTNEACSCLFIA